MRPYFLQTEAIRQLAIEREKRLWRTIALVLLCAVIVLTIGLFAGCGDIENTGAPKPEDYEGIEVTPTPSSKGHHAAVRSEKLEVSRLRQSATASQGSGSPSHLSPLTSHLLLILTSAPPEAKP